MRTIQYRIWFIIALALSLRACDAPFLLDAELGIDTEGTSTAMLLGDDVDTSAMGWVCFINIYIFLTYALCHKVANSDMITLRHSAWWGVGSMTIKFVAVAVLIGTFTYDYHFFRICLLKLHGEEMIAWEYSGIIYAFLSVALIGLLLHPYFGKKQLKEDGGERPEGSQCNASPKRMKGLNMLIAAAFAYMLIVWVYDDYGPKSELLERLNMWCYTCYPIEMLIRYFLAYAIFNSEKARKKVICIVIGYLSIFGIITAVPLEIGHMIYYLYRGEGASWLVLGFPDLLINIAFLVKVLALVADQARRSAICGDTTKCMECSR